MNRRNLICYFISTTLIPSYLCAFPITKFLGQKPDKDYLKKYFKRIYNYHCKNFFDFEKHFSKTEKEFIQMWIQKNNSLGLKINEEHYYENFIISHEFSNSKVNSSKLMLSLNTWDEESNIYLNNLLKEKKLILRSEEKASLRGIGWDLQNDIFSIYSLISNTKLKQLVEANADINLINPNYLNPILQLRSVRLKDYKETFEWHIPLRKITEDAFPQETFLDLTSCIKIISNYDKEPKYIYRVKSLSNEAVDTPVHNIIKKMASEFNAHPDYLRYIDKYNFEIKYP